MPNNTSVAVMLTLAGMSVTAMWNLFSACLLVRRQVERVRMCDYEKKVCGDLSVSKQKKGSPSNKF